MLDIGEKQPTIVMNKVTLSSHAKDRIRERMNVVDENQALQSVKNIISKGEYLGHTSNEFNQEEDYIMFAHNGWIVILHKHTYSVVTVMKKDSNKHFHTELVNKYISIGAKELRKLNRMERAKIRKLDEFRLDYNLELALIDKRIHKTRSKKVVEQCELRRMELDAVLKRYEDEIKEMRTDRKRIAQSLSIFL